MPPSRSQVLSPPTPTEDGHDFRPCHHTPPSLPTMFVHLAVTTPRHHSYNVAVHRHPTRPRECNPCSTSHTADDPPTPRTTIVTPTSNEEPCNDLDWAHTAASRTSRTAASMSVPPHMSAPPAHPLHFPAMLCCTLLMCFVTSLRTTQGTLDSVLCMKELHWAHPRLRFLRWLGAAASSSGTHGSTWTIF
jgi:hypothetical protein